MELENADTGSFPESPALALVSFPVAGSRQQRWRLGGFFARPPSPVLPGREQLSSASKGTGAQDSFPGSGVRAQAPGRWVMGLGHWVFFVLLVG